MSKKLFSKVFILLLVVGLLFAVAPTKQALAQTVPYTPDVSIQKAADEIINSQILPGGGWGNAGEIAPDTLGVIGSGLIDAYARTNDPDHLASINAAAAYLLTKTNNFSPADGMFAGKLDVLKGVTTYTTFVKTNFFDKLANGTYGATGDIDTAEYIHDLYSYHIDEGTGEEIRIGDGYLNSEDPALGLISAYMCGAPTTPWADAVKVDIEFLTGPWELSIIVSKSIYALAFVGETFNPSAGNYASAESLSQLAEFLPNYQLASGGFSYYAENPPVEGDEEAGATAWAILALDKVNSALYQTQIQAAGNWLLSVQNIAGYWGFWGNENYVSTAVSAQAVNEAFPAEVLCTTDCYVSPTGSDSNMGNEATPFATIQKAVATVAPSGTIHIAAGTYIEIGQMVINKSMTITGADKANTIIKPAQNTGSTGDPRGWFLVNSGVEFNLSNVTLDGEGYQIHTAIRTHGSGLIDNNIIKNIYYTKYVGLGISVYEGTAEISNNTFTDIERVFVHIFGVNATATSVHHNVFTGAGNVDKVQYGVEIGGSATAVISGNSFTGFSGIASDGSESSGVLVTSYYGPNPSATVTNNTFSDSSYGIMGGYLETDSSAITATGNTFTNIPISVTLQNPAIMNLATTLTANTFPPYSAIVGNNIMIPLTKLNMSPAAPPATTDTCASSYTVDVMVTDVTDLTAYHLEVGFDASKVQVTSVVNGGFLNATDAQLDPDNIIDNTNGLVIFGLAQTGTGGDPVPVDGSGSLITITFKPLIAGESAFAIDAANSMLVHWDDVQPIPFEVNGGATFNFGSVVTNTTKSPTVSYCDLDTAVSAATSGDTLRADVDFTVPTGIAVQKALTLNTNGKTITYSNPNNAMLMVYGAGDLTVTGGGVLNASDATPLSLMSFSSLTMPKITLADATISGGFRSVSIQGAMYHNPYTTPSPVLFTMTGGTTTDGIYIHGLGAELIVSGGTVTCTGDVYACPAPIYGSPSQYEEGTKVTISGTANVISPANIGPAIYQPQDGQLFVTGGTISGLNGINMEAGNLTVSGTPTITGTGGDAILMNGNIEPYYPSDLTANISGGIITSTGGYALHETALATTRTSEIAISGGKFTGSAGAVQFTTVDPAILKLTAGAYNTDPGATPDYVFEPLDTYKNTTDNYYYIDTIITGTIAAYDLPDVTETVTGDMVDFLGDIPWYNDDPVAERTQGNRVGVYITEPTGFDLSQAILTIGTQTWNWQAAKDNPTDNFVPVWKLITTVPQTTLMTVQWNPVSTQVFTVNVQTGSVLLAPPEPIITSTDIQGYYLAGEAREFNVKLEMPADGANYALMIFDYKLAGVSAAEITKFEFFAQDLGTWIDMGWRSYETYGDCTDGPGICGQFGWAPGGFGPIAAGFTNTTQFRVTFAKGFTAPLSFTLDLSGKLVATDNWTKLTTYTGSLNVYDKPTATFLDLQKYFLTGDPQNFQVTFDNPATGGTYGHVAFQISIPAAAGDITSLKYGGTALALDCTTVSGVCTTTFDFGVAGGILLAPSEGAPWLFELTAAKAGSYPMTFTLVDLDSNPDRNLQSAIGTATVHNKPVITASLLSGPFIAGVPANVVVNVDNVSVMFTPTNTFELYFTFPEGTVYVYDDVSYICTLDEGVVVCPSIPVTLVAGANALPIAITFPGTYNAPIGVELWDPDVTRITALATYTTPANVVVNGDFTVTGNFSIQGNLSRAGVPVNFDWTGTLVDYDVDGTSSADSDTNLSVLLTYGGNYTITTLQPRYLNVYVAADFSKMINLTGDRLLPELRLRGGNAYWRVVNEFNAYTDQYDNTVNGSDASVVGTDWGPNSSSDLTINHGDVNFDGKVNIQDLALVGGNFGLTSATAYDLWSPLP